MCKFKDFIIKEEITWDNLEPKINDLIDNKKFSNDIQKAIDHPDWKNFFEKIPTITKTGQITHIHGKRNPIYVRLSDGTECNFSYDEYRKIQGNPEIGKTMTIVFQRHPNDNSLQYSKIEKAICN